MTFALGHVAMLRRNSPALELGARPEIVSGWIDETQAKRAAAGARLRQRPTSGRPDAGVLFPQRQGCPGRPDDGR